jgi:N-dimethylarginine dimethylaminohydrolase
MDLYLMSPPHPAWVLRGRANPRSKRAGDVDATRARHEWLALAEGIEALGGLVAVLGPDAGHTGLPFAAEAGLPLPPAAPGRRPRFLLPRMRVEHRRGERDLWRPFVERLGFETIELTDDWAEGKYAWEGQGDVATFDGVTLLFWGGRTDLLGAHAARKHMSGEILELEVRAPAVHGNMAVLPCESAGCLMVSADVLEDDSIAVLEARFGRDRLHFVSAEEVHAYATNLLVVGDTALAPSILPQRVRRAMEREGMKVVELAMTELCEKGGGASRCLACVATGVDATIELPPDARLSHWAAEIRRPV